MTAVTWRARHWYALLAVLFVAFSAASFWLTSQTSDVVVFWPAAGVATVAAVTARPGHRPWVLLAVGMAYASAALAGDLPLAAAVFLGTVNALEAATAVVLLRGVDLRAGISDVRAWTRVAAASFGAAAVASVGTAAAVAPSMHTRFEVEVITWLLADALGQLVVVPVLLGLRFRRPTQRSRAWATEVVAAAGVLGGGLWLISLLQSHHLPLAFLAIPPLLWPALRLGVPTTAWLAGLVVMGSTPLNLNEQTGPFGDLSDVSRGLAQQLFGVGMVLTALTLAIAVEQTRRVLAQLAQSEQTFRHSFDDALLGMLVIEYAPDTSSAQIVKTNSSARQTLGLPNGSPVAWDELLAPADRITMSTVLDAMTAGSSDSWSGELQHVVDDRPAYLQVSLSGMHQGSGGRLRLTAQIVDVTSRRAAEAKLIQLSTQDPLTGLPNRASLIDQLATELQGVTPGDRLVGVLFLDLDDFKTINDAVGHTVGDDMLQAVAERLQALVRPGDIVARLGGDEFVLLCPNLQEERSAQRVAERVLASFAQPFLMDGKHYRVDASIGIAIAGPDADPGVVLRQADSAMYAAKRRGKGRAEVFDPEMEAQAARQAQLVPRLYEALHRGEFRLHFQPVVDLGSSRPVGVEALIRWQHPERGLLPPVEFLDVAEQSDLVVELGRWVLDESCRWSAMWQETLGDAAPVVHVNVSARHMTHSSFARDVKRALRKTGCSPHRLVLELTETHLLTVGAPIRRHLSELREMGIRLAADDYGTGYSPLSHVTDLDVDILKIDKSFVFSLLTDHKAHAVARAIIGLGNSLGLEVVAEGVETPAISDELVRLGCISGQGYLWSAARPAETIESLLRGQRPLAGHQPAVAPPKQRTGPQVDRSAG